MFGIDALLDPPEERCPANGDASDIVVRRGRMITLYDDVFSPYARKVRIALCERGFPFERVRALHGNCNRTDFMHVNPRAEVPALVDGSFALYDSTVICEHLEDSQPEPSLYPREARMRAKCRLIEDLADTQLDAATYAVSVVEFGRGEVNPALRQSKPSDVANPIRRAASAGPSSKRRSLRSSWRPWKPYYRTTNTEQGT